MKNLIILAITLFSFTAFSQAINLSKEKVDKMNDYIDYLVSENQIIGTVSIFQNGSNVYSKTFGHENQEYKSVESLPLLFQIGSITKLFTSVLLNKLEDGNKLSLDRKLAYYFPQMPNANGITLNQMLNHTSGLRDYVVRNEEELYWLVNAVSEEEVLAEIVRQGVLFEPGDSVSYSNGAYYLLARIVEKEYKKEYYEVLQDEIATPLNMQNTFAYKNRYAPLNVAKSMERSEDTWKEINEFYFYNASGVGDIATTMEDLNTFIDALFTGKIITKDRLQSMLPTVDKTFGKGIMAIPFYDNKLFGHGGDTFGTHSVAAYHPESKMSISYSINGESYPTNDFAIGLLSIVYDKEFEKPLFHVFEADITLYTDYIGVYGAADFPIDITIFIKDNMLMAQGQGQPSFSLNPTGLHQFDYRKAGITMEFIIEENKLSFNQGGQEIILSKK